MSARDQIISKLDALIGDLNDLLAPHRSSRDDDDQYDDPVMWWAEPLLAKVVQARAEMDE